MVQQIISSHLEHAYSLWDWPIYSSYDVPQAWKEHGISFLHALKAFRLFLKGVFFSKFQFSYISHHRLESFFSFDLRIDQPSIGKESPLLHVCMDILTWPPVVTGLSGSDIQSLGDSALCINTHSTCNIIHYLFRGQENLNLWPKPESEHLWLETELFHLERGMSCF